MKKSSALLIAAVLIFSSCGTVAQYAASDSEHRFKDGIYSNTPALRTKAEKEESRLEVDALVEKTEASMMYLFGDKKDTVMIPENMSAMIRYDQKLGGTVVTVGENPYDWRYDLENNYGYYYGPYSLGSSWYWSRHYSPWHSWSFAPWRHHGWYDPWYYSGWYDPWYYGSWYGGWYDPWYYGGYYGGYWGMYDPWYHHHMHHGWYDPYWGHHYHGPGHIDQKDVWHGSRHQTGSDRVFSSSSSVRGGIGSRSTVSRNSTISDGTGSRRQEASGRVVAGRTTATRSTATKVAAVRRAGSISTERQGTTVGSAGTDTRRPAGTVSRTGVQSNHRRPAGAAVTSGTISGTATSRETGYRSATSATRSAGYDRSSSSYNSGSSSTGRSSGFSTGSGGGYSRGSVGGGGSFSRSGGSSGGRR